MALKSYKPSTPGQRQLVLVDRSELHRRGRGPTRLIPQGHRSLAFTVTFGDDGGTLKPAALEKLQGRALDALRRAGWTVRSADPSAAT